MTTDDFRRIALSLDGAEEGSHMGAMDFRVGGRIFATLASAWTIDVDTSETSIDMTAPPMEIAGSGARARIDAAS